MHKTIVKFAFFLLLSTALGTAAAQSFKIAVADFEVTSDDPGLRYVGKGLAEMVSGELGRIRGVTVIEREKRAQILEEIEFALSGASDGEGPAPGKLAAADFVLYGKVIDMGGSVLVSARLVRVEDGEVAWSGEKLGALSDYGDLSSGIALSVAVSRGLEGAPAPAAAGRGSKGDKGAILAYSAALDALDRGDQAEARRQIAIAAKADAGNAAVKALFDKLAAPSPRYRSDVAFYTPLESPAEAALQDSGALGFWFGADIAAIATGWGRYMSDDFGLGGRAELSLPLGSRLSLRVEGLIGARASDVWTVDGNAVASGTGPRSYLGQNMDGGGLGLGCRLNDRISFGLSGLLYWSGASDMVTAEGAKVTSEYAKLGAIGAEYGASFSIAYRSADSALFAGFQASWTGLPCLYLSAPAGGGDASIGRGSMPLVVEGDLVMRVPGKRLFGSLRGVVEQDLDSRAGTFIRLLPGGEYWFDDYLSARAGLELNAYRGLSPLSFGIGGMAGLSLSFGGYELSANLSVSASHSRVFPQATGSNSPKATLLVGMAWKGIGKRPKAR